MKRARSLALAVTAIVAAGAALVVGAAAQASRVASNVREQRVERHPSEMVDVPGGSFTMGADDAEFEDLVNACIAEWGEENGRALCNVERAQLLTFYTGGKRLVYVSEFAMDRYEVTNAQYRACVSAGTCDMNPLVGGDTRFNDDDLPVVNVTFDDARTYCKWRGKRLPTEAEWEKAARGTDARRWPWGNNDHDDTANRGMAEPLFEQGYFSVDITVDDSDGAKGAVAPGSYRWGRSPYGCYDMAGNVSEWVDDWYSESGYTGLSTIDQRGPSTGAFRSVRGGSFMEPRYFARTYYRGYAKAGDRSITRGFRCAK